MDLKSRWVYFKIRDVYIPDARELSMVLHGDDVLQGKVVDVSDSGMQAQAYAVIEVEGIEQPVIVPVERLLGVV